MFLFELQQWDPRSSRGWRGEGLRFVDKPKLGNKQQAKFEKMLGMDSCCPGIGDVRLMVGVRKRDKTKIQYCITAMTPILRKKNGSHKWCGCQYAYPKDTYGNYLKGQGIASGDFCFSESLSYIRFTSSVAKVGVFIWIATVGSPFKSGMTGTEVVREKAHWSQD